jgi:hypothetical protein
MPLYAVYWLGSTGFTVYGDFETARGGLWWSIRIFSRLLSRP